MLVLADVGGVSAAYLLANAVQRVLGSSGASASQTLVFLATLPMWIVVARLYSLYDADEERTHHPTTDEFGPIFHYVSVSTALYVGLIAVTHIGRLPVSSALVFWSIALFTVMTARSAARGYSRTRSAYLQPTVILGAGEIGQRAARKILRHPEYGIRLIGLVDDDPKPLHPDLSSSPVLGGHADLLQIVSDHGVERVLVAFSNDSDEKMLETIRGLNGHDVQVNIIPRLFELVTSSVKVDGLEGLPLVDLPPVRLPRSSWIVKRAIDIVVSGIALLCLAPILGYIALRIKLDSEGPVFFRQTRLGRDQREFTALKFRTMRPNADTTIHQQLIASLMDADSAATENGKFKLENDPRVTNIGAWLRKTSLDELPQLINVFRGDMSLVGPRPCIPYERDLFEPHHFDRFLVPAGITGLWQVTARARSTFREALDMDVAYARGWSLSLDLRLLCRTPWQVLARKGAA